MGGGNRRNVIAEDGLRVLIGRQPYKAPRIVTYDNAVARIVTYVTEEYLASGLCA